MRNVKNLVQLSVLLIAISSAAYAAGLDATGTPSAGSGMPTLTAIYNQLSTGTTASVATGFQEPVSGPTTTTVRSLSQLQSALPAADNTNGATTSSVLSGKTFWGLRTDGTWGPKTGTIVSQGSVTGVNSSLTVTIPDGYYSGSKTATARDTNLTSGNIRAGVTIFGVAGDANVVNTSTGDALAAQILSGKKAWVDGSEVTGTIVSRGSVTGLTSSLTVTIPDGYYSGSKTATAVDSGFGSCAVKPGLTLFGVIGKPLPASTGQTTVYAPGDNGTNKIQGCTPAVVPSASYTYDRSNMGFSPNVLVSNFTASADNCSAGDGITGLTWPRDFNPLGTPLKTWQGALDLVASWNTSKLCGYADWRLPNINELRSLTDHNQVPAIVEVQASGLFKNYGTTINYWSSTTDANSTAAAWVINILTGGVTSTTKTGVSAYVLPVRGAVMWY